MNSKKEKVGLRGVLDEFSKLKEFSDDEMVKLAKSLRASSMESIVIFALESSKPISFLISQFMLAFEPLVGLFLDTSPYNKLAYTLADREKVEKLIRYLEGDLPEKVNKKRDDESKEGKEDEGGV